MEGANGLDTDDVIELGAPQYESTLYSYSIDCNSMESVMAAMLAMGYAPQIPFVFNSPPLSESAGDAPINNHLSPTINIEAAENKMPTRSPSYYSSRTRSRTRSPYDPYSRARSISADSRYSDGSYYSERFYSDDSRGRGRRSRSRRRPSYNKTTGPRKSMVVIPKFKPAAKKTNFKKPVKKSGAATSTPRPGAQDKVTKRMLSARRLKINELRNEIETLTKALDEIRRENKALKRDNVLQNKQLDRLQDQEGELPQMIDSHNREVRTLKEQIRKWREKNDRVSRSLKNTEDELSRSQRKVKRLQEIADDKKLEERDELGRRLNKAEIALEEKTHRVQQLERHIENLEKSHRREIVTELKKHAALKLELEAVHSDLEYTKVHLRDKEKELEVRNIYQNRIALAQRHGSVSSLPALEPPARYQPPPKSPEISPRHRAKQFEQKRREEQKAKAAKELMAHSFDSPNSASKVPPIKGNKAAATKSDTSQQKTKKVQKATSETHKQSNTGASKPTEPKAPDTPAFEKQDSWDAIVQKQQQISGPKANLSKDSLDNSFESSFNRSRDSTFVKPQTSKSFFATEIPEEGLAEEQRARQLEEERRERQREEERRERQREEERRREQEENERRREERDRREQEERERLDREEKERWAREERERQAREERERYEREQQRKQREEAELRERERQKAREAEERERKYREEAEERARIARQQEKQRLETDAKAAEERKKKDLLLQRMKDIDSGSSAPAPVISSQSKPATFTNNNSDDTFGGDFFLTSGDDGSSRKDYSFSKRDENLYRGIPASKPAPAKRNSDLFNSDNKNPLFATNKKDSIFTDNEDLDFGGYQPSSFSSKQSSSRTKLQAEETNTWKVKDDQKSNVLDDLFGGQTQSKKAPSLFDDDDFSSRKTKVVAPEKKSGFPWDSDSDKPSSPNKILPLRPRANHATIHNKPTVRAIDSFDDDLEEVVL